MCFDSMWYWSLCLVLLEYGHSRHSQSPSGLLCIFWDIMASRGPKIRCSTLLIAQNGLYFGSDWPWHVSYNNIVNNWIFVFPFLMHLECGSGVTNSGTVVTGEWEASQMFGFYMGSCVLPFSEGLCTIQTPPNWRALQRGLLDNFLITCSINIWRTQCLLSLLSISHHLWFLFMCMCNAFFEGDQLSQYGQLYLADTCFDSTCCLAFPTLVEENSQDRQYQTPFSLWRYDSVTGNKGTIHFAWQVIFCDFYARAWRGLP